MCATVACISHLARTLVRCGSPTGSLGAESFPAPARRRNNECRPCPSPQAAALTGTRIAEVPMICAKRRVARRSTTGSIRIPARRVVFAIHPGDGHEVRKLPEKQNREQHPAPQRKRAMRRGPADQRRQARRERRRRRSPGGARFQRRVKTPRYKTRGGQREQGGESVYSEREPDARRQRWWPHRKSGLRAAAKCPEGRGRDAVRRITRPCRARRID